MGRKPTVNLNLPKGMRARRQRSGKIYYYFDLGSKPRKEMSLGSDYVLAVQRWAELEASKIPACARPTIKDLAERYAREVIPLKAHKTQEENLRQLKNLMAFFCSPTPAPLEDIDPVHVRMYMDRRSKEARVGANREKALLSHMWNMARQWGYTDRANPCAGVDGNSERGRDVYIEDNVYLAVYNAGDQALKDAMDLAYLIGQRPSDTIALSEHDIKEGAIWLTQEKTGKKLRISIEGELAALLARIARSKAGYKFHSLKLIVKENGQPLTRGGLRGRFEKARDLAAELNPELAKAILAFQFRDLRAKAGTDKAESAGDIRQAQKQLGHSSMKMTEQYVRNRKGDKVGPTR